MLYAIPPWTDAGPSLSFEDVPFRLNHLRMMMVRVACAHCGSTESYLEEFIGTVGLANGVALTPSIARSPLASAPSGIMNDVVLEVVD